VGGVHFAGFGTKVTTAPVVARVDQAMALPIQLVFKGQPATGVMVADLKGGGVRVNFSNGDKTLVTLVQNDTWKEVARLLLIAGPHDIAMAASTPASHNIQLDPSIGSGGLYVAVVPASIFTRERRGPFSYGVFPV